MKSITRAFSALAFTGTVLAASTAFAAPAEIAGNAAQKQIFNAEDAIELAGKEVTPELKSSVSFFLRGLDNND